MSPPLRVCRRVAAVLAGAVLAGSLVGAARPGPDRVAALRALAAGSAACAEARRTPLYHALLAATDGVQGRLNAEPSLRLMGIDARGRPRFYQAHNLNAARTLQVDRLWPGGASGLDLTGANSPGQLALWDGGGVLVGHQEFGGRVVQMDGPVATSLHATHVAGTLVAAGVDPLARGMSPGATRPAWVWTDDEAEMAAAAAAGLLVSNHSYGFVAGWYRDTGGAWYWYGDVTIDPDEDPGFGFYGEDAQAWDRIADAAPDYLIVMSAGNDRDDTGPPAGGSYANWDPATGGWAESTVPRARDGGATGFDTLPYRAVCKNALTIGAVADIPAGYAVPADVVMTSFSGWGPTDDGRIKPDLVADGVGLTSAVNTAVTAYGSYSGTSMASPNAAGALHLLARLWQERHAGVAARAATLKAIAIHTADEAGPAPGPDYMFGWGLLNARAAAALIVAASDDSLRVLQRTLVDGARDTLLLQADGAAPLVATLGWTDPAADPPAWSLDPPDPRLRHDLDLRLEPVAGGPPALPYVLDPARPAAPAGTGDNVRDNVEQVRLAAPAAGAWRVIVSHKGRLAAPQAWSLVLSGFAPAPVPGVRNVSFAQRRDGSGLVDVTYDLATPGGAPADIVLAASADGGATWDLDVSLAQGDVGAGVTPGTGRRIVWNFAGGNPGRFGRECRVRVTVAGSP
ncbi:MAG: S8 family serine peptidase [Candidatus Krumholzibacteriia bacterium]